VLTIYNSWAQQLEKGPSEQHKYATILENMNRKHIDAQNNTILCNTSCIEFDIFVTEMKIRISLRAGEAQRIRFQIVQPVLHLLQ